MFKFKGKNGRKNEESKPNIVVKEEVPPPLIELFRAKGIPAEKIDVSVCADIDEQGKYGKQWVVLARRQLYLVNEPENQPARELVTFNLTEIREAKNHILVGGQVMELVLEGKIVELVRYSNAMADKFALAVKIINDMLRHPELESEMLKKWIQAEEERIKESKQQELPTAARHKALRRLLQMVQPYTGACLAMVLLMLAGIAMDLTPPYLTRTLVDDVLGPQAQHSDWLFKLVMALVGLQVARIIITVISNRINAVVGGKFVSDLRTRLFKKLQTLSVEFYDRKQVGGLMNRISSDTEVLQGFISHLSFGFMLNIVLIIGIGGVLFSMNWRLGLFVLIPGPLVMLATKYYWKYIMRYFHRYWISRWRINSFLSASLSGVRVVKAFAQEEREITQFDSRNAQLYSDGLEINRSWSTFFPIISFVFGAGSLLVWYFGGKLVLNNNPAYHISLGTLIAFLSYLGMFYGPLSSLTQISQWATQLLTAAHRIFEILDEPEETQSKNVVHLPYIKGKIEFRSVSFGYVPYLPVLQKISFTVEPGEIVGVIGPSGSGKTTLINLVCRFYEPTDGLIFIDETDTRFLDKNELRGQVGLVLQEPYLFRGTIAENIAYAKPEASREEIIQCAKTANAHDFIMQMPDGYETRVGERGAGLSGGERQRVSIARAILRNPRILILDEATSSVDAEAEREIQKAINSLIKNRTTFIIAHRLSTLQNVDKVMMIRNGFLKEFGRPQDLIKQDGYYRRFVRIQTDLFKLKAEYDVETMAK